MSKKLKNLKWESVALEGFPVSMSDKFQSFVGLEECTNYGLDKEAKQSKNKKQKQRPKRKSNETIQAVPIKKSKLNHQIKTENKEKVKLSNGFIVESCELATPSLTNTVSEQVKSKKKRKNEKKDKKKKPQANIEINVTKTKNKTLLKKKKKLGDDITNVVSHLTPEDMLTWAEFKLQEPIMKALTELGFKKPTKIQELTLPAAIHGRRDILGAAETGSGKTLAFGLPILSGILKLKEKAELGLDVYELPYKKTSNKKRKQEEVKVKNVKCEMLNGKKKVEHKAKESSEDGYGSDDESGNASDEETTIHNVKTKSMKNGIKVVKTKDIKKSAKKDKTKLNCEDDFIEEIEVPIRRRETSIDEGNDSDDSENYIHLSELLVSDDSADSNDDHEKEGEFETKQTRIDNDSDTESALGDDDEEAVDCVESVDNEEDCNEDNSEDCGDDDNSGENSDEQELTEDVDEENQGIGCVKVIDDVEMPGPVMVKTGKPLFALILTPTRELAIQISRHLIAVAKYTGIRVATIVGGMAAVKQERVLRSGPEIVVATPGRLWELVTQGQQHLQQLDCIKFLAIDETDRMLERGHFDELQPLLERLNADEGRRSTRQNFVFSATLTMVHELPAHMRGKKVTKRGKIINRKIEKMTPEQKIKKLINKLGMTDPKVVDITTQNLGTAETLTESRIACSLQHKDAYLYYILKRHPGRTIVFCNSIGSVKRLAQLFTILKCRPLPLHASMPQRQRLKNLERFRDDPNGVLVATDVAARGLDIPNVDHVIHYQVPRTAENYVHRSGRTARATKEGLTILLMEPAEAFLYGKLCRTLNKTSEVPTFPVPPQSLSPLKELVSLARDLDSLMLKRRRSAQSVGWREKAAREMDMIIDDDDLPVKEVDPTIDKALQIKKRQLEAMLVRPLFPKGFSFKYPTLNDPAMFVPIEENALQVMKRSLESGELKKEKRKSKNAPLLKLEKK